MNPISKIKQAKTHEDLDKIIRQDPFLMYDPEVMHHMKKKRREIVTKTQKI